MLSAAFSRVDISDSLIVADAPARAVVYNSGCRYCIYRSKPEFISEESTKETSSRPVAYNYTISVPIREYIVNFKDLLPCLGRQSAQNKREFQHTKSQALLM
jgi:hypothetical protein